MSAPFTWNDRQPAAGGEIPDGRLLPSDPAGEDIDFTGDPSPNSLPPNNHLVIYEMSTAWSRLSQPEDLDIGVGTFVDLLALIDVAVAGANFDDLAVHVFQKRRPEITRKLLNQIASSEGFCTVQKHIVLARSERLESRPPIVTSGRCSAIGLHNTASAS